MRRLVLLAAVAAAASSGLPANAAYLLGGGCASGDYTVADVAVGSVQVVKACTSEDPLKGVKGSIRCTDVICR